MDDFSLLDMFNEDWHDEVREAHELVDSEQASYVEDFNPTPSNIFYSSFKPDTGFFGCN